MFYSTGNNFGAGTIQFKDYQAENYVVLNAKITYDPSNANYRAVNVLEIYVPNLSIERSAVAGVFLTFVDREVMGESIWNYDGGTAVKSWIRDENTICIEKLTNFDDKVEHTIYIQALYTKLNQGGRVIKGVRTPIRMTQENPYLYWGYDTFCVIFEHWVFLHLEYDSCSFDHLDSRWEAQMEKFPKDVNSDVPFFGGNNQNNPSVNGFSLAHVENGVFSCESRMISFGDTGSDPFVFAFLVRDGE
ncbi:MAG: hypothetical protein K6F47_11510 [Bacteroidaceae bacterium]|nr:hypothetical protein [Bacteroidaceae bacterium]